jgi:hypothetical protein
MATHHKHHHPEDHHPDLVEWLKKRQASLKIVKTTTTPSGQTIDWVPIDSQAHSGKIASAPPAELARGGHEKPVAAAEHRAREHEGHGHGAHGHGGHERVAKTVSAELDDPSIERGPPGTVPILRPDIALMSRFAGVKRRHAKSGGFLLDRSGGKGETAPPYPTGFFHGTDTQDGSFYGWEGTINVWDPAINIPSGGNGTDHSIVQAWLINWNSSGTRQTIEGGWTVDQSLNGDLLPHLFTFYTNDNYNPLYGNNEGSYNAQYQGWVQYDGSIFPGMLLHPTSSFDGEQYEMPMKFQLYQEPTNGDFNWWVAVLGKWIGYYPASLFGPEGLAVSASVVKSGGEVYSALPNPEQTQDQMGSGFQASGGWMKAAYVRNIRLQTDMNGTMVDNNGVGSTDAALPGGANPYSIAMDMESGSNWGSYFFVGGPTSPQATFTGIIFDIDTGGDDLRGDSSATATIALPGGPQTFLLKSQSDGSWPNNSENVRSFGLAGPPQPFQAFGAVTVTLTSHDSWFETPDNWNIQSITVTLTGPSGSATLMEKNGNPLARLTNSGPSVTWQP